MTHVIARPRSNPSSSPVPAAEAGRRRLVTRLAIAGAAALAIGAMVTPPAVAATARPVPVSLARVARAPRLPAGARVLGRPAASTTISGLVALAPRDSAALGEAAAAVSNPKSTSYRHYLAKGQFAARFGPTAATIAAVKSALTASHLKVGTVSSNGLLVPFSGSIATVQSAFHTTIANVRLSNGATGRETTSSVSLPATVASQVVSVIGLDTLVTPTSHAAPPSTHSTSPVPGPAVNKLVHSPGAPNACSSAIADGAAFGGLTDDQIAHAYGVDGLYSAGDLGAGQHIAIFEGEPYLPSDLAAFDKCYFPSTATAMASRVHNIAIGGSAGTGPGEGEAILDVEDVSALAPGANIDVYTAPNSTAGAMENYSAIVNDDADQEISTSWGFCELDEQQLEPGYINVENAVFQQAAMQGQTVFSAAGDAGSDDCAGHAVVPTAPTLSTDDPSSQPYVTAVGGTAITDADNPPTENVWNDGSTLGGAGGGISSVWGAPSWQQSVLTAGDKAAAALAVTSGQTPCAQSTDGSLCRELPDISAQADEFTGAVTIYAAEFGGWSAIGGTSSATPLWAAMMADINASAGCAPGHDLGFVSPALYALAAVPAAYAASFNDVKTGNNDVYDQFGGHLYAAATGYDMASGLGSPRVVGAKGQAGLASYLCALAVPAATAPTVTQVTPRTVPSTGGGSLVVTGTNLAGITSASVGGYSVPALHISATATTVTITPAPTAAEAGTGGLGPQDGSGRAIVSLTDTATGLSAQVAGLASSVLYVDGTPPGSDVPSVSGVGPFGGADAGGNTVMVYGSDFASGDTVTVGTVPATNVNIVSPTEITATIPPFASGPTVCHGGDDPGTDVCQAQVVVTNGHGSSAKATILPPNAGAYFAGAEAGDLVAPACVTNSTCEIVPASTEYDYLAPPTITSVTTTSTGDSTTWASEQGTTIATIKGTGFDYLGFEWVDVGSATEAADQDFQTLSVSPTEIQFVVLGRNPTTNALASSLNVQTLQGLSNTSSLSYAGVPVVSKVTPPALSDTGGGTFTATGKGFEGVAPADGGSVAYLFAEIPVIGTTQLSGYAATSSTALTVSDTPATNPGPYVFTVCTITLCSSPETESQFDNSLVDFFVPSDPVVTGVSVAKGPASGGTRVKITGQNLAGVLSVKFGKTVALSQNPEVFLTNGSSTEIDAVAPPGTAGSKVDITVSTIESQYGGHPSKATTAATFSYVSSIPSAPLSIKGTVHGKTIKATWKAPASNGGHKITKYRVSAVSLPNSEKLGAKKAPNVTVVTKKGSTRSASLTGLRAGWTYLLEIRAVNSKGRGLKGEATKIYFIHDPA
jgi:Pro-kumamolisin, activation domain/Fibronectin type III domain/IPT/TIG domain